MVRRAARVVADWGFQKFDVLSSAILRNALLQQRWSDLPKRGCCELGNASTHARTHRHARAHSLSLRAVNLKDWKGVGHGEETNRASWTRYQLGGLIGTTRGRERSFVLVHSCKSKRRERRVREVKRRVRER